MASATMTPLETALRAIAASLDGRELRWALGKVSARAFDRGRDLPAEMRRALTELR